MAGTTPKARAAIYISPNESVSAEQQVYQCSVLARDLGYNDLHTVVDG